MQIMLLEEDMKGLEEDLKGLRARVAALQDVDDVLTPESWHWAEGVEAVAQRAAEVMEEEEEAMQRALSSPLSLRLRPRDQALVAELRALAARVGALRADAEETDDYSYILKTHEEMAVAARMEDVAVHMEEWMASLAARLTCGAAEFAATPGEEAFVAAKADDARSALAWYRAGAGSLPHAGGGASQAARASY
ncbi:unnamed protein product [Miscanthus lutarioriparius]|uniref:Uncharacterized protein n=1 Tax=Miscanthus lutarioriparius TaxID=422564 RepID=A0A811RA80_9POAL|nr:unnamed protein product [Miscanthus lutarioriparius]